MDQDKAVEYRLLLLRERRKLQQTLERLAKWASESERGIASTELSTYDQHIGDYGSQMFEREQDAGFAEAAERALAQVDEALDRLDRGVYGLCQNCGRPIGEERLRILPYASMCVTCQEDLEAESGLENDFNV